MHRNALKICGLTNGEDVKFCTAKNIGYVGFIAVAESKRYVSVEDVNYLSKLSERSTKVLVTQNHSPQDIAPYLKDSGISAIQLHGDESDADCAEFKHAFGLPLIKAIAVKTQKDVNVLTAYQHVDMLLFDTKRADGLSGGAGETFNWNILRHATITKPWFLSGGINADNVAKAITEVSPPFIDLSSSVEAQPGKKDHRKISDLLNILDKV